jgi:hypothetical protein
VVGPLSQRDGAPYFIVAASEQGFRCDQITVADDKDRTAFVADLGKVKGVVVHDLDCELRMAKLCEVLWPGPRISALRKAVEAEQAAKQAHNTLYQDYIKHLPAVPLDTPLERGKLYHTVMQHDDWCAFYSGAACNCNPIITRHIEPERSYRPKAGSSLRSSSVISPSVRLQAPNC